MKSSLGIITIVHSVFLPWSLSPRLCFVVCWPWSLNLERLQIMNPLPRGIYDECVMVGCVCMRVWFNVADDNLGPPLICDRDTTTCVDINQTAQGNVGSLLVVVARTFLLSARVNTREDTLIECFWTASHTATIIPACSCHVWNFTYINKYRWLVDFIISAVARSVQCKQFILTSLMRKWNRFVIAQCFVLIRLFDWPQTRLCKLFG